MQKSTCLWQPKTSLQVSSLAYFIKYATYQSGVVCWLFSFFLLFKYGGQFVNQQLNTWLKKKNAPLFPDGSTLYADITHRWRAEALLHQYRMVLEDDTDGRSLKWAELQVAQLVIHFGWKERWPEMWISTSFRTPALQLQPFDKGFWNM